MVSDWSCLQEDYLAAIPKHPPYLTGALWVLGVTMIIWDCIQHGWITHNADLHGLDASTCEQALVNRYHHETEDLYTCHHDVVPRDKDLFILMCLNTLNVNLPPTVISNGSLPGRP